MAKLFIDTNVMIDLLAERQPFYKDIAQIITLIEHEKIKIVASSLSFVNAFYVLARSYEKPLLFDMLTRFRIVCEVSSIDEITIDKSLHSGFSDFEDAVQYYSAVHHKCDVFITRNKKDFKKAEIPVITPEEFLASLNK